MIRMFLHATLVGALAAGQSFACACTLQKIDITPLGAENGDTYHGMSDDVEVLFHNDLKDRPVTLFPEPPMTLRRRQQVSECRVLDGGVWGRDGVWVAADGRTLVTTESSGSSQDLVFRDTRTCAKLATLDVAGVQWRVEGPALLLHRDGTRRAADVRVRLDADCRPAVASKRKP
jgi:hypothetical protein